MYLSRFTKYVIIPQNILGLTALFIPFFISVSKWWLLGVYVGWVVTGVFGMSTFFHKYYAHRAFELRPAFRWLAPIFNWLGMLTGQGSVLSYSAIHRCYHHRYADQNSLDPHSPRIHSFWHSYYGWHFYPTSFNMRGIKDLTNDAFLKWTHKNYHIIYILSLTLIGALSWRLLLYGVVLPGLIHVHEMNILNSFCHLKKFGYRNFETEDDSVNNWLFGILTWGTGFHNNHHAKPSAWHNQVQWYEFDPFFWLLPWIIDQRISSMGYPEKNPPHLRQVT